FDLTAREYHRKRLASELHLGRALRITEWPFHPAGQNPILEFGNRQRSHDLAGNVRSTGLLVERCVTNLDLAIAPIFLLFGDALLECLIDRLGQCFASWHSWANDGQSHHDNKSAVCAHRPILPPAN